LTFTQLAPRTPVLLVWIVGIGLAASRWQRHPRVSALATVALARAMLLTLGNVGFTVSLPFMARTQNVGQIGLLSTVVGVVTFVVDAVLWGLVLAAIFGWRKTDD
jgi:hypothetical protein